MTSHRGRLARFNGQSVMVIGHQKGRDTKEKIMRNFGMPRPEGYRKAMRLMRLAEKFGIPIMTFIDTPAPIPGVGAEERGQSEAIGRNLYEMTELRVPIICTMIGEGGSGGALAIAVGDVMLMLQYSTYSVISPEGCASILWKSAEKASGRRRDSGHYRDTLEGAGFGGQDHRRAAGRRASRLCGDYAKREEGIAGRAENGAKQTGRQFAARPLQPPDELWQIQGSRCRLADRSAGRMHSRPA